LAKSGRAGRRQSRQLSGGKRTSQFARAAAANDPKPIFSVVRSAFRSGQSVTRALTFARTAIHAARLSAFENVV
jgi:hypothetical protein